VIPCVRCVTDVKYVRFICLHDCFHLPYIVISKFVLCSSGQLSICVSVV